jgi:hypothetical protein
MTLRLLVDFNSMDKLGRARLNFVGALKDFDTDQLHIADFVILFEPEEFEVKAILDFDKGVASAPDRRGVWVASPMTRRCPSR